MISGTNSILPVVLRLLGCNVLLFLFFTRAASQELYSKTFTTKDGLPSSFIFNTYQDKLGYLWVGTAGGLSRFDGKYFINYAYNEGLPDLRTNVMMMDSRQRFWVGTPRGMAQLIGNRFHTYPLSDSGHISYVFGIMETKKGQVWALTDVGVYEFDIDKWQKVNLYPGFKNSPCRGMVENNDGIYINYGNTLVLKKKDGQFTVPGPYNKWPYYYNQLSLSADRVFISTGDGLCTVNGEQLHKLPGVLGQLKPLYLHFIDSKKRIWISSRQAGLQFTTEKDTGALTTFNKKAGVNLISGITEDSQANLWIADYNGLVKITEKAYKVYDLPRLMGRGILQNIFLSTTGTMLINDGSRDIITFENGIFEKKRFQLKGSSFLRKNEFCIENYAEDDHHHHWYALRDGKLALQDGENIYDQGKPLEQVGKVVFDVLFDEHRKKIMLAVDGQRSPCYYNDTGFCVFPFMNNIEVKGNVIQLHQCVNGVIVFATDKGMVYSINKENICRLLLNEFESNVFFRRFYDDPSGDLWIIYSGRGLRRYTWQNDSLVFKEQIDKTNGLPSDQVTNMCFDDLDNLWIAMNPGVLALSKSNAAGNNKDHYKTIAFFNAGDLNMGDANNYKFVKTKDGNIWLGMDKQLVCFYPGQIHRTLDAPVVQIENVKLNIQQTDWSLYADSLSGIFGLPANLKLDHDKNTLAFYYRAVFPSGTEDTKFSYLLQGLDTSWSPPSANDLVSFVNLPAGKYTFKVKAQLPNTGWSDPAVFFFEIKKAFWETWLFRLLMIMAASSLIVAVFQYRIKQVRNRAELKNKLQELESKALKAQMNPHFIFNAMNSIQSLIINDRTDEASSYISKFAKLMRYVLENSDAVLVTIDKELSSIQLYISLEKLRMNVKLDYVEDIDISLTTDQEKIPSLILQPFVENALWHGLSKKEGYKKLSIKLKAERNWIICEITDNGIGRMKAVEYYDQLPEGHLSKATDITLQRLISFNDSPNVTPVEIIDLKDEDGNPGGTTVRIRIKREDRFVD